MTMMDNYDDEAVVIPYVLKKDLHDLWILIAMTLRLAI